MYAADNVILVHRLSSQYVQHHMMHSKVLVILLCTFFALSCAAERPDSFATSPKDFPCPDVPVCTCSTNFKRVSCEHRNLFDIPSGIPNVATELYLGYNKLTKIRNGSFSTLNNLTQLSLLNNPITNLENLSFSGLKKLKYLTLRKNKLKTISPDAFHDLGSLQKLFLTDNFLTAVPDLSSVPNLIYLTLDTNNLGSANLCNGSANLMKLSTIILSNNANLSRIGKEDFKCVSRLSVRSVDVSRCSLKEFEDGVFEFPHLQSLKLSYNDISNDVLEGIFSSIAQSDLTSLDLSGVLQPSDIFPIDFFTNLSRVKLKHLSLSHTRGVNHITNQTFKYLPFLEYLDLSNSEFMSITDTSFSTMRNLSRISLHHNRNLHLVPKFNVSTLLRLDLNDNGQIETLSNGVFYGLSNLSNLFLQGCKIRTIERRAFSGLEKLQKLVLSRNLIASNGLPSKALSAMQNLVSLDLSFNKFTTISTEYNLFSGLTKLQWLDFSQNVCGNISTRIFQPLVNLQTLNLAGNRLGRVIETDIDGQLFRGLSKLRWLRLDNNEMRVMQHMMFSDLTSLQMLNLSNNYLSSWAPGIFNASGKLSIVDFSSNKISIVTEQELLTVPANTSLNLTDNPFACYCDLIWFRRWIQAHNTSTKLAHLQSYICNSPDQMAKKPLLEFNPDDIAKRCHLLPLMWILLGACSGVVAIMLFFGTMMYRYRWQLRLRLYYAQRRFRRRRPAGYIEVDEGYDYDIYVSYGPSDSDREWVRTELMPRFNLITQDENADGHLQGALNNDQLDERGQIEQEGLTGENDGRAARDGLPGENDSAEDPRPSLGELRVFIEEADATFGFLEFDTLAEAIYKSKKIMLVVSDEYLHDGRRLFEREWAIRSRFEKQLHLDDSIIVVCLEPDADVKVPAVLLPICRNQELEWTKQDEAGQELFWRKLAEVIQYRRDDDDLLAD
uniref:Toll-like receptor n=1 Tax=Eisenia andrei TaxID=168636 RepID=A0AA50AEX9_9ANNE|nr:Toll-like receptor [Eisenia andrei]